MEKEILQELMYDLSREKDLNNQIHLVITAAEFFVDIDSDVEDAWAFFRSELNIALTSNKNKTFSPSSISTCLTTLENNLKGVKIKIL